MLLAILLALFLGLFILVMLIIFMGPSVAKADLNQSCTVDSDCYRGLVCSDQLCKVPLESRCSSKNDCTQNATDCHHGICVGTPLGGLGGPAPCQSGLIPEYNMCKATEGNICHGDGECASGLSCVQGVCIKRPLPQLRHNLEEIRVRRMKEEEDEKVNGEEKERVQIQNEARRVQLEVIREEEENQSQSRPPSILQQMREEGNRARIQYTLVVMDPHTKKYTDLLTGYPKFNVTSATIYGQYLVLTDELGEIKLYDTVANTMKDIRVKDRVKSVALVNGFVTGLTLDGEIVQYQHEHIHSDGSTEWVGVPLHLKGRILSASPDGNYMVVVTGNTCHIYNAISSPLEHISSTEVADTVRDILLGHSLKNIIMVTEKGMQLNNERYIEARHGCFTPDGRFATVPLTATHIAKSYIFNDLTYHIVDRTKLELL